MSDPPHSPDRPAALLREALRSPGAVPFDDTVGHAAVRDAALFHGVAALLDGRTSICGWPPALLKELHQEAVARAMWELRHQQALRDVCQALARDGIEPLIFKGTALAYSLYSDPVLRSRSDTDLLVPGTSRSTVHDTLSSLGFTASNAAPSEQTTYVMRAADGSEHALDVHWRINNSALLARLFTYEELRRHAQKLFAIHPSALAPSPVHALALACMHRATHRFNPLHHGGRAHLDPDRLIWLYDIHLLACSFTAADWDAYVRVALEKELGAVSAEALAAATGWLGPCCPEATQRALAERHDEAPSRYLRAHAWQRHWMDFVALGSAAARTRWLRDLAFPPAEYMRTRYAGDRAPLPVQYLRRMVSGAARRLARREP